jgi:hypothetical protein
MPAYRTADAAAPAHSAEAVTPSNSTVLKPTRGLFVGGAGPVKVDMADTGTAITFAGVAAGTLLPIQVVKVYSTGTDATDIVALY